MKCGKRRQGAAILGGVVAMCVMLSVWGIGPGYAAKYPSQPVRALVTHPAGGSTDLPIRVIQPFAEKELGQPIVIDNIVGGGGNKARAQAYNAKPDGYTLLVSKQPSMVAGQKKSGANFDSVKFVPIYNIDGGENNVITVLADSPYKTLDDLIKASKARTIKIATTGVGTNGDLAAILMEEVMGIKQNRIPFEGNTSVPALLGGKVDVATNAAQSFDSAFKEGKVRMLATFGPKRMPRFPDLKTVAEMGFDGATFDSITGVYAPPGTPREITDILTAAFKKAGENPDFAKAAAKANLILRPMLPDELKKEIEYFNRLIQKVKFQ